MFYEQLFTQYFSYAHFYKKKINSKKNKRNLLYFRVTMFLNGINNSPEVYMLTVPQKNQLTSYVVLHDIYLVLI